MPQNDGQRVAAQAVAAELARREWNIADLVQLTGADPGTIGDFLNGSRWPKLGTQGKVEKALGWPPGTIRAISLGGTIPEPATRVDPVPVGAPADGGPHNDDHDDGLGQWLTRTKSELTDAEQEQMWKDAEPVLEALLERTLAKRRRGSTLGDT